MSIIIRETSGNPQGWKTKSSRAQKSINLSQRASHAGGCSFLACAFFSRFFSNSDPPTGCPERSTSRHHHVLLSHPQLNKHAGHTWVPRRLPIGGQSTSLQACKYNSLGHPDHHEKLAFKNWYIRPFVEIHECCEEGDQ